MILLLIHLNCSKETQCITFCLTWPGYHFLLDLTRVSLFVWPDQGITFCLTWPGNQSSKKWYPGQVKQKVIPWSGQTKSDTLVRSNKKWYLGQIKQKVIPWSSEAKSDTLVRSNKKWYPGQIKLFDLTWVSLYVWPDQGITFCLTWPGNHFLFDLTRESLFVWPDQGITLVKWSKKWYPGQVKQKVIPWSDQTKSDTLVKW
jgi:hypothetical protein